MEQAIRDGHFNGFHHWMFKEGFDIGFMFQKQEPHKFPIDAETGAKAWAAPVLVLLISAVDTDSSMPKTLRYGLDCSKWANVLTPAANDQEKLRELAFPLRSINEPMIQSFSRGS